MDATTTGGHPPSKKKRSTRHRTTIYALSHDILSTLFSFLDLLDLVRCSAVCKSWNIIISKSKLLQTLYCKQQKNSGSTFDLSTSSERLLNLHLQKLAVDCHRFSMQEGPINVFQWKGHSVGVDQCRMKTGLILTGVGDKVMRLWSAENYKCLDEFSLPDRAPLVDFDFDESKVKQSSSTCKGAHGKQKQSRAVDRSGQFCVFFFLQLQCNHWTSERTSRRPFEKVVGLVGTRICIWRRNGKRNIFSSREGLFTRGLCMRYVDPEAVVGCEDGTVRLFDMYSRKCSQIIKMHAGPVTCLGLSDDQLIVCGSSLGSVSLPDLSSDQRVAALRSTNSGGVRTLCFNPSSHLVFAGSTAGYVSCWDLRTMRTLWNTRVSPNVIYSMHHLRSDRSTLVVGGIDGVLRFLDQDSGEVFSRCIMNESSSSISNSSRDSYGVIEVKKARRLSEDTRIDLIPKTSRPSVRCLAVGMQKVVTTHNEKYIRVWKFNR